MQPFKTTCAKKYVPGKYFILVFAESLFTSSVPSVHPVFNKEHSFEAESKINEIQVGAFLLHKKLHLAKVNGYLTLSFLNRRTSFEHIFASLFST